MKEKVESKSVQSGIFPERYSENQLPSYLQRIMEIMSEMTNDGQSPRFNGDSSEERFSQLLNKYAEVPESYGDPIEVLQKVVRDLFAGAVNWKSPHLQYNVGAPSNVAATAAYSAALDANIFNINSGLGGNSLVAERAVASALSGLAGLDPSKTFGIFTFGGTSTNLYALKLGINSVSPHAKERGVPKNISAIITEDSHFSHSVSADWLGIGTDNLLTAKPNADRRSGVDSIEKLMRQAVERKQILAAVMLNGGTTYDHAIDDIEAVVRIRDQIMKEYHLTYSPHIHVDSVIGWVWLMFNKYDFENNPLDIDSKTLSSLKEQAARIAPTALADSWGADFHKGAGCCPVPCSVFMVNNRKKLVHLSKKHSHTDIHQLAEEYSFESPVDITLETSRPSGAPIAALTALHTMGLEGYRRNLANLVRTGIQIREGLADANEIACCNPDSLGYVSMARIYPPNTAASVRIGELNDDQFSQDQSKNISTYNKAFFTWDNQTRMQNSDVDVYSFSSKYIALPNGVEIPAMKFIPTSPNITPEHVDALISTIHQRKRIFDEHVWPMISKSK